MSKKGQKRYVCSECGGTSPKWAGQCPDCGAWNTLSEILLQDNNSGKKPAGYAGSQDAQIRNLADFSNNAEEKRLPTGLSELDRVLGGGLVQGSVVLLGGDPGIGKSTLLLQALATMSANKSGLYVSGEESGAQIADRARRLNLDVNKLQVLTETCIEHVVNKTKSQAPSILVMDSIQTFFTESLGSAPGSVAQVRETAAQLVRFAKNTGTAIFIVGHVTKEGAIAGPRVLEHMVDTVLYFEGDSGSRYRLIRAMKNRFGAVNELGILAMTETGLRAVGNPSAIFLSRHPESVAGSAILVTREGTRPLLVEVQALVDHSSLGNPRRVTLGLESNRLAVLLAVLHRHGGISLGDQDVFLNVVGGVRITETAADLPVALAVLSSFRDRPLDMGLAAFGEIGLAGEVRPVPNGEERIREAAKHGFNRLIVPKANQPKKNPSGVEISGVTRLSEALELI